ncbi:MAG: Stf0 family sulfotransferase [Candidatus Sphingomonas phytovorans]|nr:Stf0 family sulfotransferase [Sphingomonas sp.]WEJ98093.1 MAG: Stf0 family sulfotransferase [Sphingomonas sp.]
MYGISRGYIIAALPRTGSFLLCDMLARLGSVGYPQEYGLPEDEATWSGHHGHASHLSYFYDFFRFCSTPNGVFGCKLMWSQFAGLHHDIRRYTRIEGQGLEPIEAMTGPIRLVFLDRRDTVMQAISLVRAMETNIWSSHRTLPPPPLAYSGAAIADAIEVIGENRRQWESFFARHAIDPLRLFYEDVAQGDVAALFPFLGVEAPDRPTHATRLKRQADDQSRAWRDRFLIENAA